MYNSRLLPYCLFKYFPYSWAYHFQTFQYSVVALAHPLWCHVVLLHRVSFSLLDDHPWNFIIGYLVGIMIHCNSVSRVGSSLLDCLLFSSLDCTLHGTCGPFWVIHLCLWWVSCVFLWKHTFIHHDVHLNLNACTCIWLYANCALSYSICNFSFRKHLLIILLQEPCVWFSSLSHSTWLYSRSILVFSTSGEHVPLWFLCDDRIHIISLYSLLHIFCFQWQWGWVFQFSIPVSAARKPSVQCQHARK